MQETYRIIGVESSPYTVKVRAVMRFRRLPHVWLSRMPQYFEETEHVRPLLMPVVQFPVTNQRDPLATRPEQPYRQPQGWHTGAQPDTGLS